MKSQASTPRSRTENGIPEEVLLLKAMTAVSSTLDFNTILSRLAETMAQAINVTSAYALDWHATNNTMKVVAEYISDSATSAESISKLDKTFDFDEIEDFPFNWFNKSANVTVSHLADPNLPAWRRKEMQNHAVKTSLLIRLENKDEVLGFLDLWESRYRRDFLPNELELCEAIAHHASVVLAHARLYGSERRRRQEAEIYNEVIEYVTASLDLKEVVSRTLHTIRRYLHGIHSCNIGLLDIDGDVLHLLTDWEVDPNYNVVESDEYINVNTTFACRIALEKRQPFWINDLRQYPFANIRLKKAVKKGLYSLLYIPLIVQEKIIGMLLVHAWHKPRPFSQKEVILCRGVINQAAMAIEHARLFAETRQQAKELALMNQVAVATAATTEEGELLAETTSLIALNLYPEVFGFVIVDELSNAPVLHQSFVGLSKEPVANEAFPANSLVSYVIDTGQAFNISQNLGDMHLRCLLPSSKSAIAAPLKINDQVVAVVCAESENNLDFDENDVRFLTTFAGQVATALERARLYGALRQQAVSLARQVSIRTAELQAERDRTVAILESAGEGIVLTDKDGRILYVNPALVKQTGYSRAELLNQNPRILNSEKESISTFSNLWETILQGNYWSAEMVNRRKDGSLYDVSLTTTPLLSADGELNGFVSVHADITHLKEVDRMKTEFTATVTHELRTPLTNIKTYLSLLERGKPEKRERYLHILQEEADRLTRLIQNLLDLSQLEITSPYDSDASVDILIRMAELLSGFHAEADKRGIIFQEQIPAQLPKLHISESHFDTVLTHLLNNAFAFTPSQSEVKLSIMEDADQVRIELMDNGIGIPADEIPHIFDRFFRGLAARDQNIPGTGLGLSIVDSIIRRYNGRIQVESVPDGGTQFTVWFPITE